MKELSDEQDSDQIINAEQAAKAAQELEDVKQKLEKERLANEEKIRKEKEGMWQGLDWALYFIRLLKLTRPIACFILGMFEMCCQLSISGRICARVNKDMLKMLACLQRF